MARFVYIFALLVIGFLDITLSCAGGGMRDVARQMQKVNPQKCMQCPELKLSKLCQYTSIKKGLTCGEARIDYYTFWKTHTCGKAIIHCSAIPPHGLTAVIGIEQFTIETSITNITSINENNTMFLENNNTTFMENNNTTDNSTFVVDSNLDNIDEGSGTDVDGFTPDEIATAASMDVEPYAWLTEEKKYYVSATLTCNNQGKWEAKTMDDKIIEGFENVHCIVEKSG